MLKSKKCANVKNFFDKLLRRHCFIYSYKTNKNPLKFKGDIIACLTNVKSYLIDIFQFVSYHFFKFQDIFVVSCFNIASVIAKCL